MIHLKLYENKFNTNSLKKFVKEKDELYSLIKEYSILHELYDFDDENHIVNDFYYEYNVNEVGDEVIIVGTLYSKKIKQRKDNYYVISDLYDLNKFISDPIQYKKSLKYNL
jgi:hypothetical protein